MSKLVGFKKPSIKKDLLEPFKPAKPLNVKTLLMKHLATQLATVKKTQSTLKGIKSK